MEMAIDAIERASRGTVGNRGAYPLAPPHPLQTQAAHQAFDRAAGYGNAFALQLMPDLAYTVDLHVGLPDTPNLCHQTLVALAACAAQFWPSLAGGVMPICRWGNLQHLADRLDPVDVPVPVDIGVYFFSSRSSAAWAKKALADFRISLARRSSLFSRSRAFMRSRSLVAMPSRMPLSISLRLTHSSSVAGTQPIFGAIDSTAAHSDGYSPRCSCTRRTARSRTSGENLFCLLIVAPFSQRVEPP